jgi:hypothetical protein
MSLFGMTKSTLLIYALTIILMISSCSQQQISSVSFQHRQQQQRQSKQLPTTKYLLSMMDKNAKMVLFFFKSHTNTLQIIFKLVMSYAVIIRRIPKPRDGGNGEELPKFTTALFIVTRMGNVTFSLMTVM